MRWPWGERDPSPIRDRLPPPCRPRLLATSKQLFVLLEGAYVTAAMEGDEGVVERVRDLGAEMVAAATGRKGATRG